MQDSWPQLKSNSWQLTLKSSHNLQNQWHEYTLSRNESLSDPKEWIRGNTMIGPVLEVTICWLQGKFGVEIWMESENKGNSHSWVRNFPGLTRLVTVLVDKEQETAETKTEVLTFASRKAKAKTTKNIHCHLLERKRIDIKWGTQSNFACPVAKRQNTLLRHGQFVSRRWDDGILEIKRFSSERFWTISVFVWWSGRV